MTVASLIAGTQLAIRWLPCLAGLLTVPGFVIAAAGMAVLTQLQAGSDYVTGLLPAEILPEPVLGVLLDVAAAEEGPRRLRMDAVSVLPAHTPDVALLVDE